MKWASARPSGGAGSSAICVPPRGSFGGPEVEYPSDRGVHHRSGLSAWFDRDVETLALIEQLDLEGVRLATAADRAGWDAPVPRTDWNVRDLVTHVGGVHRWATDVVRTGAIDLDTRIGRGVGRGPDDGELLEWFVIGHAALVSALRDAPPDLSAGTFLPAPSPLHFWARRQAHETAIHRADADAASGQLSNFAPDFAQDGISEMLHGFAARRSIVIDPEATILLHPADGPSWLVITRRRADSCGHGRGRRPGRPRPNPPRRNLVRPLPVALEPRFARGPRRLTGDR